MYRVEYKVGVYEPGCPIPLTVPKGGEVDIVYMDFPFTELEQRIEEYEKSRGIGLAYGNGTVAIHVYKVEAVEGIILAKLLNSKKRE